MWITGNSGCTGVSSKSFHRTPNADPGLAWREVDTQSVALLNAVWGSSTSDVWAVGEVGTIRHITPPYVRWQEVASPTKATLRSVWGSGPNDIWVVGDAGTILHYDGTSFTSSSAQFPVGKKPRLNGVWGSGPNDVWIVGNSVTLHYTGPKPGANRGGGR